MKKGSGWESLRSSLEGCAALPLLLYFSLRQKLQDMLRGVPPFLGSDSEYEFVDLSPEMQRAEMARQIDQYVNFLRESYFSLPPKHTPQEKELCFRLETYLQAQLRKIPEEAEYQRSLLLLEFVMQWFTLEELKVTWHVFEQYRARIYDEASMTALTLVEKRELAYKAVSSYIESEMNAPLSLSGKFDHVEMVKSLLNSIDEWSLVEKLNDF